MRILVTNDDGIHSEGSTSAPRSAAHCPTTSGWWRRNSTSPGVSHSLSLNDPLRLREVGERRFAVKGTPTDCVIMGARHVIKDRPPDLVLSGVNRGRNAGEDVIYSGTVAGAVEGTMLGIPSFALSQAYKSAQRPAAPLGDRDPVRPRHHPARARGGHSARRADQRQLSRLRAREVKGIAVTNQGRNRQERLHIEARQDGRGNDYYWIAYVRMRGLPPADGSDISALADNRIAVTPLRLDMTDEPFMTKLAELFD